MDRLDGSIWGNAMLSSRVAAALERKRRKEPEVEDDRALFGKGLEMVEGIGRWVEDFRKFVEEKDWGGYRENQLGNVFFKITGTLNSMEDYTKRVDSYIACLNGCLSGCDVKTKETMEFFDEMSGYFSRKLPAAQV